MRTHLHICVVAFMETDAQYAQEQNGKILKVNLHYDSCVQ